MNWICGRMFVQSLTVVTMLIALSSSAIAQTGGGATGGTGAGTSGGGSTGSGGIGGGSTGGFGGGASGGAGGTGGQAGTGLGSGLGGGSSSGSTVNQTNFLSTTYSNPLYMGRPNQIGQTGTASPPTGSTLSNGTTTNLEPAGGFGQPSFGSATTSTTGAGSAGGTARGAGAGGSVVSANLQQTSNSRLHYSTVIKFPTRPIVAPQLYAELRAILDRSTMIQNPTEIKVFVNGNTVTLRGTAINDDERRLVEGIVRLTPGVREVRNELAVVE